MLFQFGSMRKYFTVICVLVISVLLLSCSAGTPVRTDKYGTPQRKIPSISERFGKNITYVNNFLMPSDGSKSNPKEALKVLLEMQKTQGMNAYEQAMLEQYMGYSYVNLENYTKAISHFERALSYSPSIPLQTEIQIYKMIGQLYAAIHKPDMALKNYLQYKEIVGDVSADDGYLLACTYYEMHDMNNALLYINEAINKKNKQGERSNESWFILKKGILLENNNYAEALLVVEELVKYYPKELYVKEVEQIRNKINDNKSTSSGADVQRK